ncbi:MAG: capsular biosynthesis protein [Chloroflexi bacterium]|nr:capsular biosynthesis protein [Chloroflexota bacterium]
MTLVTLTTPNSAAAEAWRTLRTNLQFAALEAPLKTVVIAAPDAGGSAAEAAANLAVVCAQIGRRVVLVDADLRQPQIHTVLGLPNASGLVEALAAPGVAIPLQAGPVHGLRVLTAGAGSVIASDALSSARMMDVLQEIAREADLVLVHTAPAAVYSDAAVLAAGSDAAILIVTRDRTRRDAVAAARDALRRAHARLLGAVVN